jgi:S-formylglutathione hydrolase FrmB
VQLELPAVTFFGRTGWFLAALAAVLLLSAGEAPEQSYPQEPTDAGVTDGLQEPPEPLYPPHRIMIFGDAAEGLVEDLDKALAGATEVELLAGPVTDVGLMTPKEADWPTMVGRALDAHEPSVIVMVAGRNDWQRPRDPRGRANRSVAGDKLKKDGLAADYQARVDAVLEVAGASGAQLFVLSAAPPAPALAKKAARTPWVASGLGAACAARPGCVFVVDAWTDPAQAAVAARTMEGLATRLSWEPAPPPPPPPPPPNRWDDDGRLLVEAETASETLIVHWSEARGKDVMYWAFVPESLGQDETFPVLYLLHGAWGGHNDWRDHAQGQLLGLARQYGIVIITPDGDQFGWYLDSPLETESRLESYVLHELIPHVEERSLLPVEPGPESRAIAGLSMGGHGAFVLTLRNPATFVSASSMSGILDIRTHPTSWHIKDRLGRLAENPAGWEEHSATALLLTGGDPAAELLFTVSTGDTAAYAENLELHDQLVDLGIPHEYEEAPGGHTWEYWTSVIGAHLDFHAEWLRGDGIRRAPVGAAE